MRIIVTADLHLHPKLTTEEILQDFLRTIPPCDLFVVAGDLGERGGYFEECLPLLKTVGAHETAILLGNHDLWTAHSKISSEQLWVNILPDAIRAAGFTYLEDEIIRLGSIAVVGTIAWYDYSFDKTALPAIARLHKSNYTNDGRYMTDWDDIDFAERCYNRLRQRLMELEKDNSISEVLVVTHVPVFQEQHVHRHGDKRAADVYFYNITMGDMIRNFKKVRHVISGHTHRPVRVKVGSIDVATVDSDYKSPGYVELEFHS